MNYRKVSGSVFAVVALVHVLRSVLAIPIQIGSHTIGLVVSWIAAIVAAALAFWAFRDV